MNLLIPENYDFSFFRKGIDYKTYEVFGAHNIKYEENVGVSFCVWSPRASEVRVVGNFNNWNGSNHRMKKIDGFGVWWAFIEGLEEEEIYKYEIITPEGNNFLKSDPYAFYSEVRPNTASKIFNLSRYEWQDKDYMKAKQEEQIYHKPMLIYEVHLGSWKRKENNEFKNYRELAEELISYVSDLGYTHIELMPISEHPFDGSWGYQAIGYFSITSRYGSPFDFMYFVNKCHEKGIGVILDWVPAHFCKDSHGLRQFDGLPLYEYELLEKAENHGWGTLNFDLGRPEVLSFLISNAMFFYEIFHIDGIRVDAVASMLYLDYGKESGKWKPNKFGGRENLEAIEFFKRLNEAVFREYPYALMIAEESTAWPMVTKPTYVGGLGFNYKWNMGWMNDILKYFQIDPIHRKWHHNLITFSLMYAFSENYILCLSHDEVVHGKKSLLDKMSGDYWHKFASLRAFYGFMMAHPGKKLVFMGGEFGQFIEWRFAGELDWMLLDYEMHSCLLKYVKELNFFYLKESCLWEMDHEPTGFQWIDANDYSKSIISFMRIGYSRDNYLIIICNFTPMCYEAYRIGVPENVEYEEVFNSDITEYCGSGCNNQDKLYSVKMPWHSEKYSLEIKVPPMSTIFLAPKKDISETNKIN